MLWKSHTHTHTKFELTIEKYENYNINTVEKNERKKQQ